MSEEDVRAAGPWRAAPGGRGILAGVRVVDFTVMGPGPFGSMLLASWGADVIGVVRPDAAPLPLAGAPYDVGKRRIALDLKQPGGREVAASLAAGADVLMESFRPGVMERLGLGPDELCARHPELVYVRVTGYGQSGPYASRAGHDINYLAVSGALSVLGGREPAPPLQLLGDLAGGGVGALVGVLLALRSRERTGVGGVVDTAIVDAVAQLFSSTAGRADPAHALRLLDGTAPFYTTYVCGDGRRISVGALEPHFFAALLRGLGIEDPDLAARQHDVASWPRLRARLAERFATRPRDEWDDILGHVDCCVAPVVELDELADQPHLRARGIYDRDDQGVRMVRAPVLEGAPPADLVALAPATREILTALGLPADRIAALHDSGAAADPR